jgi:uncharacterized protein YggE
MFSNQAIQTPLGVTVFGSALLRVSPDIASINFVVSSLEPHPKNAFTKTRSDVQRVRAYLTQAAIDDVQSSHIKLTSVYRYVQGEEQFQGYSANVTFHVLMRDLDRLEELLSGIVDAGVNNIKSVDFQSTRLKEFRAQARMQAVQAAREKAELYCEAAGAQLGRVLHIEDVNPDRLRGGEGHMSRETPLDDDGPARAFDPGSITVGGAVQVLYQIEA